MKNKARVFGPLVVLLLTVLSLAACGGDEKASLSQLKVGYGFGYGTNYSADQFGFDKLEAEGIKVKAEELGSPTDAIAALDSGQLDAVNVGSNQVVPAVQEGAKVRVVLPVNMIYEFMVVGGPGVKQVSDLKGKKMMIGSTGGLSFAFISDLLAKAGVKQSEVTMPEVRDSSTRIVALRSGTVDAALVDQLDLTRLQLEGGDYTVLGRAVDFQPQGPANSWVFSKSFLDEHPDVVQRFVSAMLDGYEQAATDDGRKRFLSQVEAGFLKGEDPKLAERVYDWYRSVHYWPTRDNVFTKEAYAKLMTYWVPHEVVGPNPPAFDKVWDTSFWEKA